MVETLITSNSLTPAQQIFGVFYAIFFGIMLQTIGSQRTNPNNKTNSNKPEVTLNLFDTPNAWAIGYKYWNKPFWRFLLSIIFLNLFPALVFGLIFIGLNSLTHKIGIVEILIIVWISLIPHYIYRIYLGILLLFKEELFLSSTDSKTYSKADIDAKILLETDRTLRKDGQRSPLNHLAIPLLFMFPLMIILYNHFLVNEQISGLAIYLSYLLIIFGLIKFIAPRKDT